MHKTLIIFLIFIFLPCLSESGGHSPQKNRPHLTAVKQAQLRGEKTVGQVYRLIIGKRNDLDICIVDGPKVRRKIYHEFLYGGNDERYLFNPPNEIWIDNSISAEEYSYTLAHEINERSLMANYGYTYTAAHDSSLRLEHQMRLKDQEAAKLHEAELKKVSPTDCDGIKQITELADSIRLSGIYLSLYEIRDGIAIWIVDGSLIRKDIYPDFGLSGNEYVYHFIPHGEIWIDAQISCEETEFSILRETIQRNLMSKGMNYDLSYQRALSKETKMRYKKAREVLLKPPIRLPKHKMEREKGTGGGSGQNNNKAKL